MDSPAYVREIISEHVNADLWLLNRLFRPGASTRSTTSEHSAENIPSAASDLLQPAPAYMVDNSGNHRGTAPDKG
jgi:hypothetical protein